MNRFVTSATLLAFSCLTPVLSKADTFNFSLTGPGLSSTGTLTTQADPTLAGIQDIIGITGTISDLAAHNTSTVYNITGLAPGHTVNTINFADTFSVTYDNQINLSSPGLFDIYGLAFQDSTGVFYNVATDPVLGILYEEFTGDLPTDQRTYGGVPVTFALSASTAVTPEPSSLLLLGTGLIGVAGAFKRRLA